MAAITDRRLLSGEDRMPVRNDVSMPLLPIRAVDHTGFKRFWGGESLAQLGFQFGV